MGVWRFEGEAGKDEADLPWRSDLRHLDRRGYHGCNNNIHSIIWFFSTEAKAIYNLQIWREKPILTHTYFVTTSSLQRYLLDRVIFLHISLCSTPHTLSPHCVDKMYQLLLIVLKLVFFVPSPYSIWVRVEATCIVIHLFIIVPELSLFLVPFYFCHPHPKICLLEEERAGFKWGFY